MGFVSYGGLSGGTRAVQELKGPVTTLGMMPLPEAVNIPFFAKHINDNGEFESYDSAERSAEVMLKKLKRWAKALKQMRKKEIALRIYSVGVRNIYRLYLFIMIFYSFICIC